MMSRLKLSTLILLFAGLLLGGCGIRPGDLSPPDKVKEDKFPHVYPYDPTGKVKNK